MPRKIGTENWRKKRRQEHLEMKEYRYYMMLRSKPQFSKIAGALLCQN